MSGQSVPFHIGMIVATIVAHVAFVLGFVIALVSFNVHLETEPFYHFLAVRTLFIRFCMLFHMTVVVILLFCFERALTAFI